MSSKANRKTEKNKTHNHAEDFTGVFTLKIVALICGASVMGLEMVGVRLLEPFLGSTHYVWGAIIGIFLAALSIGYWFGGRLADRHPSLKVLGFLILAGAVLIFIIPWMVTDVCNGLLKLTSSLKMRALLASLALFALPSIILGMVSPFAVRLAAKNVSNMGRVAGSLYAISTLGSIIGTLLVSFILVELIGNRMIVWGIGVILVIVALVCFQKSRRTLGVIAVIGMITALLGYYGVVYAESEFLAMSYILYEDKGNGLASDGGAADNVIDLVESVYHDITVIESRFIAERSIEVGPGGKARYMKLGRVVQGGVIIDSNGAFTEYPPLIAHSYPVKFHLGLLINGVAPKRVLVIGCGCGIAPLSFAHDYDGVIERIDVVDIDPYVFSMARKHFGYDDTGSVIVSHVTDGRMFIRESDETWDFVILDAFTSGGRKPKHLLTQEFYSDIQSHLSDNGVIAINVISPVEGEKGRFFRSIYNTVDTVFENTYAFSSRGKVNKLENVFIFATNNTKRLSYADLKSRYEKLMADTIKQPRKFTEITVDNLLPGPSSYKDFVILTDDFCPVDKVIDR